MNNRSVGVSFLCLAAVLYLSRYFMAMMYRGSNPKTWGAQDFDRFMDFVSAAPWTFAAIALLLGLVYLVRAEKEK